MQIGFKDIFKKKKGNIRNGIDYLVPLLSLYTESKLLSLGLSCTISSPMLVGVLKLLSGVH